jgi:hypothetical protein
MQGGFEVALDVFVVDGVYTISITAMLHTGDYDDEV